MRTRPVVLIDTNAIILLLRIAPNMFRDSQYDCVLPEYVYQEFMQKPEFKDLFPWRSEYKGYLHVGITNNAAYKHPQFASTLKTITCMARTNLNRNKERYGLSKKDQEILSVAVAFCLDLCTEDVNLALFAKNEFSVKVFSALSMINRWLQGGLIVWDDKKQQLLQEWNGRRQPKEEISTFQKLTGYSYP